MATRKTTAVCVSLIPAACDEDNSIHAESESQLKQKIIIERDQGEERNRI